MNKTMKNKYCTGCSNNFYNGNTTVGPGECWSLEESKVVWRKEVHIDQSPPWNQKAIRVLDCYRKPRHVYVSANQIK